MKSEAGFEHAMSLLADNTLWNQRPVHLSSLLNPGDEIDALCGRIFKDDCRRRPPGSDLWDCKRRNNGGSISKMENLDPSDPDLFLMMQYGTVHLRCSSATLNYNEYSVRRRAHSEQCKHRGFKCKCTSSYYVNWRSADGTAGRYTKIFYVTKVQNSGKREMTDAKQGGQVAQGTVKPRPRKQGGLLELGLSTIQDLPVKRQQSSHNSAVQLAEIVVSPAKSLRSASFDSLSPRCRCSMALLVVLVVAMVLWGQFFTILTARPKDIAGQF